MRVNGFGFMCKPLSMMFGTYGINLGSGCVSKDVVLLSPKHWFRWNSYSKTATFTAHDVVKSRPSLINYKTAPVEAL